jgi:hypothetical protein
VSVFRIDSCTIKRGNLWLSGYRVPLGEVIIAYALGTYSLCPRLLDVVGLGPITNDGDKSP